MRIALLLLGLVLVVAAVLFGTRPAAPPAPDVAGEGFVVEASRGAAPELAAGPAAREAVALDPARGPEPADEEVPDAADPPDEEPPGVEGDLEARTPITIRVVDASDAPVPEASVEIWAMRSVDEPGAHSLYRGEQPFGETDREGRVELDHWEWVSIDSRTGQVTLQITHPDFVTFTGDVPIGPGERVVRLDRGATVVVTGWYGSPSNVIEDLALEVDREAKLAPDAWKRLADGRLATNRLPAGMHWIVASHDHAELGRLSSTAEGFEVGEVGWETLHLELHPPIAFVGELDASVPRPVVDGHVMLVLTAGGVSGGGPSLSQRFEADVQPDGSFVLPDLRPGTGRIFALCRGWSSKREDLDRGRPTLQRAEVPQVDAPHVVRMERTGTLEVTVLGPSGAPVEGATVNASPNVVVRRVGAWIHPWRDWTSTTGPDGIARIEDLPPTEYLWFGASADGLRMTAADRVETPEVEIHSGETTFREIQLELGED